MTATVQSRRLPVTRTVTSRPGLTMLGVTSSRNVGALSPEPYEEASAAEAAETSHTPLHATSTAAASRPRRRALTPTRASALCPRAPKLAFRLIRDTPFRSSSLPGERLSCRTARPSPTPAQSNRGRRPPSSRSVAPQRPCPKPTRRLCPPFLTRRNEGQKPTHRSSSRERERHSRAWNDAENLGPACASNRTRGQLNRSRCAKADDRPAARSHASPRGAPL